jgi:alkylation response protein AidB-like acyl-CoA dehydrogenase
VDSKSAGILVQPLVGLSGKRTNAVFYDKVRVPTENLVGEEGRGWEYMTSAALAFERVFPVGDVEREFEDLLAEPRRRGALPPYVRQRLAELAIKIRIARLLSARITWMQSRGVVPGYEADALKLYHSELWQALASAALSMQGQAGTAADGRGGGSSAARHGHVFLDGRAASRRSRTTTGRGGVKRGPRCRVDDARWGRAGQCRLMEILHGGLRGSAEDAVYW